MYFSLELRRSIANYRICGATFDWGFVYLTEEAQNAHSTRQRYRPHFPLKTKDQRSPKTLVYGFIESQLPRENNVSHVVNTECRGASV